MFCVTVGIDDVNPGLTESIDWWLPVYKGRHFLTSWSDTSSTFTTSYLNPLLLISRSVMHSGACIKLVAFPAAGEEGGRREGRSGGEGRIKRRGDSG